MIDLRLGDWRQVLADVEQCDAVITDPPFGGRTHDGQRHGRKESRYTPDPTMALAGRGIDYTHLTPEQVQAFVNQWAPRCTGWFVAFTSHDLWPVYEQALEALGRYVFAPLSALQVYRNVRLAGDGPANWSDWLVVSRPRNKRFARWGALPGGYWGLSFDRGENALDRSKRVVGGKPLWLMRALVRDYTRSGDLIVDPFAGGGTTLLAAAIEGRQAIGAEVNPDTHAQATARLARGFTPSLPGMNGPTHTQREMFKDSDGNE